MTDADVDGSHIRTLLLTFFYRKMPELVKRGHIFIAQPPLYKVKRKKREEYVDNEDQMTKILIELGSEDVHLFRLKDKKEFVGQALKGVLESLQELEKLADSISRRGIDFEQYLEARDEKSGALPSHAIRIKDKDGVRFEFARNDRELAKLTEKVEEDLEDLLKEDVEDPKKGGNGDEAKAKRIKVLALYESNGIQSVIETLDKKGFNIDHYATQENPLLELIEGGSESDEKEEAAKAEKGEKEKGATAKKDKEKAKVKAVEKRTPIHSIPDILSQIKEIGKRGLTIQRYKGLGEMNPEQLWETTMDPERRKMLKVELMDAADADNIFTILMGDEVEPRRLFIEENALNVRNLDV